MEAINYLINRTDAIGDTLLTTPLAQMLKENFPKAKVYFLVSKYTSSLFRNNPYVDGVLIYSPTKGVFKRSGDFLKEVRKLKITHYLYVGGSQLPTFLSFMAGVKFRGGLKSKLWSFLFLNKGVRQIRSLVEMHEVEYNLKLLEPLGLIYQSVQRSKYTPKLYLEEKEKKLAQDLLNKELENSKLSKCSEYIILHPGMKGHTLNWPSRNYARLLHGIERKFPEKFNFIISFTPSDEAYLKAIREELADPKNNFLKNKVLMWNGANYDLRTYMGLLSGASLFVGPSTGPLHMANALKMKALALFSPIKVQSALRWGPFQSDDERVRVIVPDVVCGEIFKCAGKMCLYHECMSKVEVQDVLVQACDLIDN